MSNKILSETIKTKCLKNSYVVNRYQALRPFYRVIANKLPFWVSHWCSHQQKSSIKNHVKYIFKFKRFYTYPLPIFKQYDHYANLQTLPLCKRFPIPPKVIQREKFFVELRTLSSTIIYIIKSKSKTPQYLARNTFRIFR